MLNYENIVYPGQKLYRLWHQSIIIGTDLTLDIPLRNPKKDTTITNEEKLMKKRYKGIVLHLRAKADSTGKIKVGFNKDKKD